MTPDVLLGGGRYRVRGVLGEGAQGTTYEAVDTRDGRSVAIKRFDVRGARSWKDVELAEREVRVLSTLDHPLVPRYFEHFEHDGALYLVMEKVEGETLEAIRRREGPLPEHEVRRFLADADRALTYLHGRASPIVHRDIKPRNIVRRPNGSYVFVDFGAVSELMMRRDGASTVVGTMGYMAPEQVQGCAQPATDVYAVGATALAALTGVEPETLPHQGLRIDVKSALHGRISPALVGSLERMIEPDPERRAASLAAALDAPRSEAPLPPPHAPVALGMHPPAPQPMPGAPYVDAEKEDAAVRSIRKLLWLLWGLGWILVPVVVGRVFHADDLIPIIMFGSLAALFIVSWHKGALIRAALRAPMQRRSGAVQPLPAHITRAHQASAPRRRVDIGPEHQIRVHASEIRPDELVGQTERQTSMSDARHAHRR
jgi:hypothetical protein